MSPRPRLFPFGLAAVILALGGWGCLSVAGECAVEGRVVLPRGPAAPVLIERYTIVSKGGILSPYPPVAVIYLEGTLTRPASLPTRQVAQKNLAFVPNLLAVQVGTRVEFPNLDDTYHNIFSYSAPKRFDLGRYRKDEKPVPSEVFDVPGLVTLRCDIHEHMRGLILVLDTPYFVLTGTDGRYRLEGLPSGRYVLKAWIDSRTTLSKPVALEPASTVHEDFP